MDDASNVVYICHLSLHFTQIPIHPRKLLTIYLWNQVPFQNPVSPLMENEVSRSVLTRVDAVEHAVGSNGVLFTYCSQVDRNEEYKTCLFVLTMKITMVKCCR